MPLKFSDSPLVPVELLGQGDFTPDRGERSDNADTFRRFSRMNLDAQLEEVFRVLGDVGSPSPSRWSRPPNSPKRPDVGATGNPYVPPYEGSSIPSKVAISTRATSIHSRYGEFSDTGSICDDGKAGLDTVLGSEPAGPRSSPVPDTLLSKPIKSPPYNLLRAEPRFIPSGRSFETVRTPNRSIDPRAAALAQTEDISKVALRPVTKARNVHDHPQSGPAGTEQVKAVPVGTYAEIPVTPVRGE
jgi:hypothetical protein